MAGMVKNQFVLGWPITTIATKPILYAGSRTVRTSGLEALAGFRLRSRPAHASDFTRPPNQCAHRSMICNSSRRSDLVFDPFCGQDRHYCGRQLERIGYGVEIAPLCRSTLERYRTWAEPGV